MMATAMVKLGMAGLALTALSAFADHRRRNRRDVDRVGFMPWPLLSMLGVLVALVGFALALRTGGGE